MNKNQEDQISKFLSLILRHHPEKIELTLDSKGWADVNDIIEKSKAKYPDLTEKDLFAIVKNNDKSRFSISENGKKIRANQGHSIEIDLDLLATCPPDILYHGTATRFLESILEKGILKMERLHVHLTDQIETAKKVGLRHGNAVVLEISAKSMHENGILFFKSENGVWLTDFVNFKYISVIPD